MAKRLMEAIYEELLVICNKYSDRTIYETDDFLPFTEPLYDIAGDIASMIGKLNDEPEPYIEVEPDEVGQDEGR